MNTFQIISSILNEQNVSYSKASISKEEDGMKEQKTKTTFSGNLSGMADKKNFKGQDADPNELAMGIKIEMEHTDDPTIAKKIAVDHLSEIPDYYTRLKKMEDEAKSNKNEQ
jgi:hypothetical protein